MRSRMFRGFLSVPVAVGAALATLALCNLVFADVVVNMEFGSSSTVESAVWRNRAPHGHHRLWAIDVLRLGLRRSDRWSGDARCFRATVEAGWQRHPRQRRGR